MKVKALIPVLGVLGLASIFIPMEGGISLFTVLQLLGMGYLVPVAGGFVLAAIAGAAAAKSPPAAWGAPAAVAGFGIIFVRMEMWKVGDLFSGPFVTKLFGFAVLGGLAVSIVGLVKKEEAA